VGLGGFVGRGAAVEQGRITAMAFVAPAVCAARPATSSALEVEKTSLLGYSNVTRPILSGHQNLLSQIQTNICCLIGEMFHMACTIMNRSIIFVSDLDLRKET
jgi:hypothetical protein